MAGRRRVRKRAGRAASLLLVVSTASGCTSPLWTSVPDARLRATGGYRFVESLVVPPVTGVAGCGAQALASALAAVGAPTRADAETHDAAAIAATLPWHDTGASPVELLLVARARGASARIARGTWNDVAAALGDGGVRLVMLDASPVVPTLFGAIPTGTVLHWSAVSGAATDGSAVLLGAPARRHHVVEREEFLRRWEASDRCLIVVGRGPGEGERD